VFEADSGNRVVWRHDRSGKLAGRIGEKNKDRNVPGFVLPARFSMWSCTGRTVRVNNPGRHQVEAYTPDGDLELVWGKATMGIEGFCGAANPIALALRPMAAS